MAYRAQQAATSVWISLKHAHTISSHNDTREHRNTHFIGMKTSPPECNGRKYRASTDGQVSWNHSVKASNALQREKDFKQKQNLHSE